MSKFVRDVKKKFFNDEQQVPEASTPDSTEPERKYKKYTEQDKDEFFFLVHKKGMSTRAAALELGINPSTAQTWVHKEKDAKDDEITRSLKASSEKVSEESSEVPHSNSPMNATKTYKKYTDEDKENLIDLVKEGKSTHAAALELGINPSTAQTWMNKEKEAQDERNSQVSEQPMNATRTYKKYSPQDKENLFRLIREGNNVRKSALELGINPSTAQGWVTKEKKEAEEAGRTSYLVQEKPIKEIPKVTSDDTHVEKVVDRAPSQETNGKKTYKRYTQDEKDELFNLIKEKGLSTRAAALQLGISPSTAYNWIKKEKEASSILSDEQEQFLTQMIEEQGVLTLDEMLESLRVEFKDFNIPKSELCQYAMRKYTICFSV